jgi:hypothetical protein
MPTIRQINVSPNIGKVTDRVNEKTRDVYNAIGLITTDGDIVPFTPVVTPVNNVSSPVASELTIDTSLLNIGETIVVVHQDLTNLDFVNTIITTLVELFPTYPAETEYCNSVNIVWLNKFGGYENYIFSGRKQVYEVNEGENIEYKQYDLTKKNAQLTNIYRAFIISTDSIPSEHLMKLESLRNSIQAWIYFDWLPVYFSDDEKFIPILVDRDSMITYDNKEKNVIRTFKFTVAKEIKVQTQ